MSDPDATVQEDSLEYRAMRKATPDLIKSIQSEDAYSLADELYGVDLLSKDVYGKVCDESDSNKAARMITRAVTEEVENEHLKFMEFINILMKKEFVVLFKEFINILKKKEFVALAEKLEKLKEDLETPKAIQEQDKETNNGQTENFQSNSVSESPAHHSRVASVSSSNASDMEAEFAPDQTQKKRLLSDSAPTSVPKHSRNQSSSSGNTSDIETDHPRGSSVQFQVEAEAPSQHPTTEIFSSPELCDNEPVLIPDCKPKDVLKVIRKVSSENLYHLQILLIQHEDGKNIIDFINERQSYVYERYNLTVYFWFKTCKKSSKPPSWEELIKSLYECKENVLAYKVESGVVFEEPDVTELDGIHRPASPPILSHSNISAKKLPVSNPVTKKGKDIISEAYSHLHRGYEELKFEVCELLDKHEVPFEDFLKFAKRHFSPEIGYATKDMKEFLEMAQECRELNMWHYGSLESTLERILGIDAKVKFLFSEYEEKLTNYLTTTKIIDYLKSKDAEDLLIMPKQKKTFAVHEKSCCEELGVKIDINIEEESLQYISRLWRSLQKRFYLAPITVILEDIREGCIHVVLNVPKEVSNALNTMSQKATDYFTSQKIRSVWINSECVYHQDIHAKKDTAKAHFWLAQACESGRILEVYAILEVPDIDVNFLHVVDGKTPLMLASKEGHEEIVKILLQRKALPNRKDASGWSALFFAAHMGHEKVVKVLLEERADVLMTDEEGSPVLDITKKLSKAYQLIDEVTKTHLYLFEACERGDLQKVHSIVNLSTTNVDTIRSDGRTPLIVAAQCGHPDIAVCLISCEANVLISDERGYVAADYVADGPDIWNPLREETLFTASAKGNTEVLKKVLENKTDPNTKENDEEAYTPLMYACKNGHHEVVELLIQHKADPNYVANDSWTALLYACINKHYTIVKTLLENNVNVNDQTSDGWSPLMLVAADGSKEIFELLLDHKADPELPDKKGYNPLIQAAQDGHCDIIELLEERDSLSLQIEEYRTSNPEDWSALMFAAKNGHTDIVKYIVNKDPDTAHRSKEDGVTLLHLASYHGHVNLVKYFLFELKLNVDAQDEDGITPLMYAAQIGNLSVVKQLRRKIANVNLTEEKIGWNAVFIAMQYKHQDVLDYLLKCDVNFDHKDKKGNNLFHLSLMFNREAFRLLKATYEKVANQKNVSPESVSSVGEPVMSFESLLGDLQSQQNYSYIEEFRKSFSRKVEVTAK